MSDPWFKFYPTDWRSDPRLRMCSMAARGYREEYYLRQEQPDARDTEATEEWRQALSLAGGWMDILIAKNRMGETGGVRVRFDERFGYVRGGAA